MGIEQLLQIVIIMALTLRTTLAIVLFDYINQNEVS